MTNIQHATMEDYPSIKEIFKTYKDLFPHVRQDYLRNNISKNNVIYENEVVIVYNKYKKNTNIGTFKALKGTYILHQIVTTKHDGRASIVFNKLLNNINDPLYLTVRAANQKAVDFYIRNGLKEIGTISWAKNTIPGKVFGYSPDTLLK